MSKTENVAHRIAKATQDAVSKAAQAARGKSPDEPAAGPGTRTPTGAELTEGPAAFAQQGRFLTTAQGVQLRDSDHSLKAGERGPTLLQDHHLREKITHFDHERIPERVVHARGAGAHGVFMGYGNAGSVCSAGFLQEDVCTPVFVRFSTVLGSRGSADTARDTRGFATKFYTDEGTFDLVGNNMPVFFIQDGIKFPDVVHAAKPHPDLEIPQAQSAHDTFWDFVSLHTEAQHHTLWNMSDRGIPRSYRTMEGFGVHTFRLINDAGESTLVKFHWKPRLGVHSLTWEEAQLLGGMDPDFHRRDLAAAIDAGAFPQWELGIQAFADTADEMFEGIDLLDPTKLVPEELAPVQPIGLMTLNANPTNYFAETEQVAFHVGNLVPGIDVTNDALMQARLFSYLDTQITRLAGPNFSQIPINRPHAPVNDMLRDGFHQTAVHEGIAPYKSNSLDAGCPFFSSGQPDKAFLDFEAVIPATTKRRASPASFEDHFSHARLFWASMSPIEQDHIVLAYSFELSRVKGKVIRERQLQALANIAPELCAQVATRLGLDAPEATVPFERVDPSRALSQVGERWPIEGRVIGVVMDAAVSGIDREVRTAVAAIYDAGCVPVVVAAQGGVLDDGIEIARTFGSTRSVEFDALILVGSPPPASDVGTSPALAAPDVAQPTLDPRVRVIVEECWRHAKVIGGWGEGLSALTAMGITGDVAGVVTATSIADVVAGVLEELPAHRVWDRTVVSA